MELGVWSWEFEVWSLEAEVSNVSKGFSSVRILKVRNFGFGYTHAVVLCVVVLINTVET